MIKFFKSILHTIWVWYVILFNLPMDRVVLHNGMVNIYRRYSVKECAKGKPRGKFMFQTTLKEFDRIFIKRRV